uniref:Uncharacterized protein n=1 Tax=Tetradesmus obliquus TaxID=3088 RepID=A0A383VXP1_TETOB|eukprot:jgi/Sobl393_1/11323/SZX70245.1
MQWAVRRGALLLLVVGALVAVHAPAAQARNPSGSHSRLMEGQPESTLSAINLHLDSAGRSLLISSSCSPVPTPQNTVLSTQGYYGQCITTSVTCTGECINGWSSGVTASGARRPDPVATCDTSTSYVWVITNPCLPPCPVSSVTVPTASGVNSSAGCSGTPLPDGGTCSWSCSSGYVAAQGSSPTSTCRNGVLSQPAACNPADCSTDPLAILKATPVAPGAQLPSSFIRANGSSCGNGKHDEVCNAACPGASATGQAALTAKCALGNWNFTGSCPAAQPVDNVQLSTLLPLILLSGNYGGNSNRGGYYRRSLQEAASNSSSNNSSSSDDDSDGVEITIEIVQRIDGAKWRASGGNVQPSAVQALQQLLDDLIKRGVAAVLPNFASSLFRDAGLTLDEAATLLSLKNTTITFSVKKGSQCYAGTQAFAPEGFPCYQCPADSISQDGGECVPCTIPNSEPNPAQTACSCKYGYDAVLLGGQLQMCKQWYIDTHCAAIPHSEVNAVGNGCSCTFGFQEQVNDATGKLTACFPIDCSTTPGAELDASGAVCTCKQGFVAAASAADGSLQCLAAAQPAADDAAAGTAGTWLTIDVLVNDAGSPTRIKSVSSTILGGRAIITADAASGKDVIRYISNTPATAGTDTFNYTTELGSAAVSVTLTPGACAEIRCGFQRRGAAAQPGTCQAGRCVCVPGSGMASVFVRNPSAAAAALTPQVPACRYRGFTPVGDFIAPGKIIDVVAAAGEQSLSFRLSKDAATAECFDVQPVTFLGIRRLSSCPAAKKRSIVVTAAAVAPEFAPDLSLSCNKGLYTVAVPIPGGPVGSCYDVVLRLADGTSRRAVMRDVGSGNSG